MNYILFEQSGTFKEVFKKNKLPVVDVDIVKTNNVDFCVNIFYEIDKYFNREKGLFDEITNKDFILAFFPCTFFSCQNVVAFKNIKSYDECINRMFEVYKHFKYFNLLLKICDEKQIPIVVENPYKQPHFLTLYHFLKPTLIINDRTELGDYFKKPTQFYSLNIELSRSLFITLDFPKNFKLKKIEEKRGLERSLISTEFANNFFNLYLKDFFINRGDL